MSTHRFLPVGCVNQAPHRLDYIRFFHLRSFDRLNAPYPTFIKQIEERSGVTFHQAQVALARRWIGDVSSGQWHQPVIKIAAPDADGRQSGNPNEQTGGAVGFGGPGGFKLPFGKKETPKPSGPVVEEVPVPQSEEESERIIQQFERGSQGLRDDDPVSDSIAQHVLGDSTGLHQEQWLGNEEEEKSG